jgi:hypothetical protein
MKVSELKCLNETYRKVRVGKFRMDRARRRLSQFLFNFDLEYTNRKKEIGRRNQKGVGNEWDTPIFGLC